MRTRLRRRTSAAITSLFVALVAVAGLGGIVPAQAATGAVVGYADKCVDVADGNSADGTPVQLYTCNGTAAQTWDVRADGTIRALGKCLDVAWADPANGTRVQIVGCNGNAAQQWTHHADGTLRALGKCLDVDGWNSADRTPLVIWDCHGGANQQWTLPTGGGGDPQPGRMAGAPYLYLGWGNPQNPVDVMNQTGVRGFTMAFMLSSGGCNPAWDGQRPLTGGVDEQTIDAIKAAGGQVQISFGGWSGNKLGPNCATPEAFAGAVQRVIDAHHPHVVDFDIENSDEFENEVVQDRILRGLAIVRQNNPDTKIVVTFGTGVNGPTWWGTRLINRAAEFGTPIDNYTIMPFNFGGGDMRADTISAAQGLKNQLMAAHGWSEAEAYAHVGISGMNGLSDQGETTTPAQWTAIRDWARAQGVGRFAYWSVNRDRPCPGGGVTSNCSGIAQADLEFTRITAGF
ncbi:chitinase [Myceligenerans xiligouense]|uniref:Ricin-type beta-trefoil lectin protein n=1 Tax=Myceligenerans xiligouense TaxID=253184 RepID=A0A3N4YNV5_9MICO|nr:chitinase [Myceligenerans xiligouense]RPF21136.1 ricin-type beta-trefoil lectin protein [Myceligenerans xiligouense]